MAKETPSGLHPIRETDLKVAVLETNVEHMGREIGEIKEDVEQLQKQFGELNDTAIETNIIVKQLRDSRHGTAEIRNAAKKEFEALNPKKTSVWQAAWMPWAICVAFCVITIIIAAAIVLGRPVSEVLPVGG